MDNPFSDMSKPWSNESNISSNSRTKFALGEMLDSFDHLLCCARFCSMLFYAVYWQSKMFGELSTFSFALGYAKSCSVKC